MCTWQCTQVHVHVVLQCTHEWWVLLVAGDVDFINVQVIRNNQSLEDCPDIFGGDSLDTEVNVGFIRQCYFNQIFDAVQEYDVYRYMCMYTPVHVHHSLQHRNVLCLLLHFCVSLLHPDLHLVCTLLSRPLSSQQVCIRYHHLLHGSVVSGADTGGYCTGGGGLEEGSLARQQNYTVTLWWHCIASVSAIVYTWLYIQWRGCVYNVHVHCTCIHN